MVTTNILNVSTFNKAFGVILRFHVHGFWLGFQVQRDEFGDQLVHWLHGAPHHVVVTTQTLKFVVTASDFRV